MTATRFTDLEETRIMEHSTTFTEDTNEGSAVTRIYRSNQYHDNRDSTHFDATRIATIDPKTGTEITEDADMGMERTIVQPVSGNPLKQDNNINAAYIPESNYRQPGDATSHWNPGAERLGNMARWVRRHRILTICMAVCVGAAVVVPAFSLQASTQSKSSPVQTRSQNFKDAPVNPQKENSNSVSKCTLAEAVTLLMDGEYEKARAAYRFLSKKYPDNHSFALTLAILETQEEYQ